MKRALIVEDDQAMAGLVSHHLESLGYAVQHAQMGEEGYLLGKQNVYQLIVLDLMLPDADGLEVCKLLRQESIDSPIIMLTAKVEEFDTVLGLELGADDYIKKPFRAREFLARVKAVARRYGRPTFTQQRNEFKRIVYSNLEIDLNGRIVRLSDERIELTPKEFDLLVLLASHPGRSYSRSQLLDSVWGYQFQGFEHTVNSHINRLRAKIERNSAQPKFILTTWGVGYRFSDTLEAGA